VQRLLGQVGDDVGLMAAAFAITITMELALGAVVALMGTREGVLRVVQR
jgi:hypothetical protein